MPAFRLMAEPAGEVRVPIFFRFNSEIYDPAIFSNEASMRSIFNLIDSVGADHIQKIDITGFSSPEGVYEYNQKVSLHRARSVAKIIRSRYQPLSQRVHVDGGGEAWAELRASVAADTKLTTASRDKVLRFLNDTTISNDTRKWRLINWLKNDPNVGPIYPYLLRNHYRKLRSGVVVVIYESQDEPETTKPSAAPAQPEKQPQDTATVARPVQPADTLVAVPPVEPQTDTTAVAHLVDTLAQPAQPADTAEFAPALDSVTKAALQEPLRQTSDHTARRGFIPAAGISTNLPYDITYVPGYGITTIPSFSFEYYPASRGRWTYGADVEWPMWKHWDTQRFMQINNVTLWTRRYFKDPAVRPQGAYLLGSVNGARFGVGFNQKGWIGEGLGLSVGAGYKIPLGQSRFWFDAGVALGIFYAAYDPYVYGNDALGWYYYDYAGKPEDFTERNKRWLWIGPTRIYFSIGFDLFNRNKEGKR